MAKFGWAMRRHGARLGVLLLLGLLYTALFQRYRAYDVDNPWFLSFSYNACHGGPLTDQFEGMSYPQGMDGVHLFGKVAAHAQCLVLNRAGWMPPGMVGLNLAFTLAALWLWWSALARLGCRERWIAAFLLFLGAMEPVVSMVEKGRYEFFSFFLLSAALWLGAGRREFAAALVAFLAVETEPSAIVIPISLIVLLALRTSDRRGLALKCAVAGLAALAFYVWLHPGAIAELAHPRVSAWPEALGGTERGYFIDRPRHLPELAMLAIGIVLSLLRRAAGAGRSALWAGLAATAVLLAMPHSNVAYEVFAMPFLLWAALDGYDGAGAWRWIPAAVFAGILAQYGWLCRLSGARSPTGLPAKATAQKQCKSPQPQQNQDFAVIEFFKSYGINTLPIRELRDPDLKSLF